MRPHASVGTAVKLPTMFEQFGTSPFFVPNPELTPEESFGWDAGVEFTFFKGVAIFDVTYFRAEPHRQDQRHRTRAASGHVHVGQPAGREHARGRGGGGPLQAHARDLTLGGAYTYTDARNPDGERELRRPPHAGKRGPRLRRSRAGAAPPPSAPSTTATMEDLAFRHAVLLPDRSACCSTTTGCVNATASYKLQPGVEVFGRVENLLDQHYQEVYGFEAPPIAAYAGVKLTFGGAGGSPARLK